MMLQAMLLFSIFAGCIGASSTQQFDFPNPFGKYSVGKTQFFLDHTTDHDPIAPSDWNRTTSFLLVSVYYPTEETFGARTSLRWIDDTFAKIVERGWGIPPGMLEQIYTRLQWKASPLNSAADASSLPTVFISPGSGAPCSVFTILGTDLASRGYTVVCIDHPGEPSYLAFPPGSASPGVYGRDINNLDYPVPLVNRVIGIRIADAQALIKAWPEIAEQHGFPGDVCRFVGVGHSLGGAVIAGLVAENAELLGGINMDGTFYGIAGKDAQRPFLLLTSTGHNSSIDNTWEETQTGWWEELTVNQTVHMNYGDYSHVVDMLGLPKGDFAGPIGAERMRVITAKLVESLFAKADGEEISFLGEQFPNEAWPEIIRVKASW